MSITVLQARRASNGAAKAQKSGKGPAMLCSAVSSGMMSALAASEGCGANGL